MIYFYFFFATLGLGSLAAVRRYGLQLFIACSFVLFLLFLSLRWETGTDWYSYYEFFQQLDNYRMFEIGYVFENNLVRMFTNSFTVFLIINSFFALLPIFYFLKKEARRLAPLGLLFFYSYYYLITYFGSDRRIIAIGFCFTAAFAILYGRMWLGLLLIVLGGCFHSSAGLCLLYFPLASSSAMQRFYIRIGIAFGILVALGFAFYQQLLAIDIIAHPLLQFAYYLNPELTPPPAGYNLFLVSLLSMTKRSVILFFILISVRYLKLNDMKTKFFVRSYVFSYVLYLVSILTVNLFDTFTIYFSIFEIILVPRIISHYKGYTRVLIILVFVCYLLLQTYNATEGNPYATLYLPYRWIGGTLN